MDIRCIEVIDDKTAAILKQKTPRERLEIAFGLWRTARTMLYNNLRSLHPDWDKETIAKEVSSRMSHGSK
ncbi:MAG: hypothetical protein R6V02_01080 [Candidatus Aminicenantes bacterium]